MLLFKLYRLKLQVPAIQVYPVSSTRKVK